MLIVLNQQQDHKCQDIAIIEIMESTAQQHHKKTTRGKKKERSLHVFHINVNRQYLIQKKLHEHYYNVCLKVCLPFNSHKNKFRAKHLNFKHQKRTIAAFQKHEDKLK